jgi:hypothetical protein
MNVKNGVGVEPKHGNKRGRSVISRDLTAKAGMARSENTLISGARRKTFVSYHLLRIHIGLEAGH